MHTRRFAFLTFFILLLALSVFIRLEGLGGSWFGVSARRFDIEHFIAYFKRLRGEGAGALSVYFTKLSPLYLYFWLPLTRLPSDPETIIRHIRDTLKLETFADISTLEEGLAAEQMGATYVSTTLSGYTAYTEPKPETPDLELIASLSARLTIPVVAEGRFNTPDLARAALDAGAYAVVVGTMITNPREITKAFVRGLRP